MGDKAESHERAAVRHERAAEHHERSATFWDDQGDRPRAQLQRTIAEYERLGADLERWWGELADPNGARRLANTGGLTALEDTREGARRLAATLTETAKALERSALLAEGHAERRQEAGRSDDAAQERQAGERAHEAAQRARSQAEEWLKLAESLER